MFINHKIAMALGASCVVASMAVSPISDAEEKRSAENYWSEFKQDSKQSWDSTKEAFRDGWIEGKLETALIVNEHLNPFKIDIDVDNNVATLAGTVSTDIEKELAEEVAMSIEGIDKVKNNIKIDQNAQKYSATEAEGDRKLGQQIKDATITASIKTELLKSPNTQGLKIDVDTENAEVVLSGKVKTKAEKNLAEVIAKNNGDVRSVTNKIEIES